MLIAPVGDAFERHYAQTDAPRLQGADNYHPVLAGAYLEAAVLFGAMYGLPPTNITAGPAKGSLPAALASRLRQTASDTLGLKPPAP